MHQQRLLINAPQPRAPVASHNSDQAKLIFNLLQKDTTQVKLLHSYQKMFAVLARNMAADWKVLGRLLGVEKSSLYAIGKDHRDSVQEQANQMFLKWLEENGSAATLGILITAVYESGPSYWNLLDIVNKYAPKY